MENALVSYMTKLQNMADYLARGGIIRSSDGYTAIRVVKNESVKQRNAFSIEEYDLYDELEKSFFGEQKSIGILVDYINDGEYEVQIEGKTDFEKEYKPNPEDEEFYLMVMKRIKSVFKLMAVSLVAGTQIPLQSYELSSLKMAYLEDEEYEFESEEDETEHAYLIYDIKEGCFCVKDENNEIIIEDVEIETSMEIYSNYLIKQEQENLYEKAIKNRKRQKGIEQNGSSKEDISLGE